MTKKVELRWDLAEANRQWAEIVARLKAEIAKLKEEVK